VETVYFVAFGPVIPRRVALQESPRLFDRTKRIWGFDDGGQFKKGGSPEPRRQIKRSISQMRKAIFPAMSLAGGFPAI
jgi:hypothetical protein